MSAHPGTAERTPVRRPGTLTAAVVVAVLTAAASIVDGVLIATGGRDLIRDILADAGLPADTLTDANLERAVVVAGYSSLDDFEATFAVRGYLALAAGVLLAVFALLMRGAATWTRALVTVSALLALAFAGVVVADETTTTMAVLALLTALGAVLSIICTWLPANGRHVTAGR